MKRRYRKPGAATTSAFAASGLGMLGLGEKRKREED